MYSSWNNHGSIDHRRPLFGRSDRVVAVVAAQCPPSGARRIARSRTARHAFPHVPSGCEVLAQSKDVNVSPKSGFFVAALLWNAIKNDQKLID